MSIALIELISFLFKIRQNYSIIFLKIMWRKQIIIFSQSFSFKHKVNKSNKEVSAHYWIVCLCSKNICFDVFIFNKCFNLFRNVFYSETIKISNIIIIHMQSNPMSSNIRILIKIYYKCPISWVKTIKSRFIFIIFLYFKVC